MKNTKLPVVLALFAIILACVLSCTDQENLVEDEKFTSVEIPVVYKRTSSMGRTASSTEEVIRDIKVTNLKGEVVYGKVKLTMLTDEDGLVGFEITQNIFDKTELTPTFWTDAVAKDGFSGGRVEGIGSCLKDCQTLEKGDGRGWCKAGCWVELAAVVAVVIIAL